MKKIWFDNYNGQLGFFSYFCKHDLFKLILLFARKAVFQFLLVFLLISLSFLAAVKFRRKRSSAFEIAKCHCFPIVPFQMLAIFVIVLLQLSFLNKMINWFFWLTVCQLKATGLRSISFDQWLDLFFRRKHVAKNIERALLHGSNGRLVVFSYFCKHDPF